MQKLSLLLVSLLLLSGSIYAQQKGCNHSFLGLAPSLYEGRLLPLNALSKRLFKQFSLSKEYQGSTSKLFCEMAIGKASAKYLIYHPIIHPKNKAFLENHGVSTKGQMTPLDIYPILSDMKKNLLAVKEDQRREFYKIYSSALEMQRLERGDVWKVPSNSEFKTFSKLQALTINEKKDYSSIIDEKIGYTLSLSSIDSLKLLTEGVIVSKGFKVFIFFSCALAFLLSFVSLKATSILSGIGTVLVFFHVFGRSLVTSRAPVTDMFETMIFACMVIMLITQIPGLRKWQKYSSLSAMFFYSTFLFAPELFPSDMKELRPVLRDNFWLSTHVTSVVISYAIFLLSWFVANFHLFKKSKITRDDRKSIIKIMNAGCIFLFAGITLGAVWADKAWGRFWAWDPKETWSLICLMFYIAVIHADNFIKLNNYKFMILSSLSFFGVIMAWFGVNYMITTGMHTYGFKEEGGVLFVLSLIAVQMTIVIISTYKNRQRL